MQYSTSSEGYSSTKKDSSNRNNKGDKGYAYKKSSYQYSTSGDNNIVYADKLVDQNVDQLDALLEDLKNERQITREKDLLSPSSSYRTIEREKMEPGTVTKTRKIIKTSTHSGIDRGMDDFGNTMPDYSTVELNEFSTMQDKREKPSHMQNKVVPGNLYETQSKIYESTYSGNTELLPPHKTCSTTHLEKDLQNITLSEDILPIPGTKVTTTVRTYTYEVPANTANTTYNSSNQFNNITSFNKAQFDQTKDISQSYPVSRPSNQQTVVYNTESYLTTNKNNVVPSKIYEINERREVNTMSNNSVPQHTVPPSGVSKTIVYNVNKTENIQTTPKSSNIPHDLYQNPLSPNSLHNRVPPQPTTSRYFYKESSNTVNTIHDSMIPREPSAKYSLHSPTVPPTKPLPNDYPRGGYHPSGHEPNPTTVTYNYSSTTTDMRHDRDHGIAPPFPVDMDDNRIPNGGPPQRVDDLMESFGNTDAVDKSVIETPHRKREIETAVASPNQPQILPSVNKVGKDVYYPPGHGTMMMKHEEMAAGSAAGGRWAKGSGMYEYESGSKSKTKSKSGGAMVPVCLPLCCAMPCSIM